MLRDDQPSTDIVNGTDLRKMKVRMSIRRCSNFLFSNIENTLLEEILKLVISSNNRDTLSIKLVITLKRYENNRVQQHRS